MKSLILLLSVWYSQSIVENVDLTGCQVFTNFEGSWRLLKRHNEEFSYTLIRNETQANFKEQKMDFAFLFNGQLMSPTYGLQQSQASQSYSLVTEQTVNCKTGGGLFQFIFTGSSIDNVNITLDTQQTACIDTPLVPLCPPHSCVDKNCQICTYNQNRTFSESCRLCTTCGGFFMHQGGKIQNDYMQWKSYGDKCSSENPISSDSFQLCCATKNKANVTLMKLCKQCGGDYPYQNGRRSYIYGITREGPKPKYEITGDYCSGFVEENYDGPFYFCGYQPDDCSLCTSCNKNQISFSTMELTLKQSLWKVFSSSYCNNPGITSASKQFIDYNSDVMILSRVQRKARGFKLDSETCRLCKTCGSYFYINGGYINKDNVKWEIYGDNCDEFSKIDSNQYNLCCAPQVVNPDLPTCKFCSSCGNEFPNENGIRNPLNLDFLISGNQCRSQAFDKNSAFSLCCSQDQCRFNEKCLYISVGKTKVNNIRIWSGYKQDQCFKQQSMEESSGNMKVCCMKKEFEFKGKIQEPSCKLCQSCNQFSYSQSGGKIMNDFVNWRINGENCDESSISEQYGFELCCIPKEINSCSPVCKLCKSCGSQQYANKQGTRRVKPGYYLQFDIFGDNCLEKVSDNQVTEFSLCCESSQECSFCESCSTGSVEIGSATFQDEKLWSYFVPDNSIQLVGNADISVCCDKKSYPKGMLKDSNTCNFCQKCGGQFQYFGGEISNDFMVWPVLSGDCNEREMIKSNKFQFCCLPSDYDPTQPSCRFCQSCGDKYPNLTGQRLYNNGIDVIYTIYNENCKDKVPSENSKQIQSFSVCCENLFDYYFCESDTLGSTEQIIGGTSYQEYHTWFGSDQNRCLNSQNQIDNSVYVDEVNFCCNKWEWNNGQQVRFEEKYAYDKQNYYICDESVVKVFGLLIIIHLLLS